MTLEDFFTLTEMKDGLTAPSRVEELVIVMRKEIDCVVKNVGDATRQWAAVASTIVATENKDCLDLFINLDGLWFIDRWLRDAHKFANDTSNSFVEESITALLRALEKLHVDIERSISSGIWYTVENLIGHESSRVQDRARTLFDSWKKVRDNDAVHQNVEKVEAVNTPFSGESVNEGTQVPAQGEIVSQNNLLRSADTVDMEVKSSDLLASSVVSNSVQGKLPMKEEPPVCTTGGTTSIESCNSPVSRQGNVGQSDVLKLSELIVNEKQMHKVGSSLEKLRVTEISSASSVLEPGAVSSGADTANDKGFVKEPAFQNNTDAKDSDLCQNITAPNDIRTLDSEPKSGMDDTGVLNHCSIQELLATGQDGECCSNALQDSFSNECLSGKPEDPETSFSRMEDIGAADEDEEGSSDRCDNLTNASVFSILAMDTRSPEVRDKGRSTFEHDYGIVDALEVARQVAQEVEREVVDNREPFCSSSSDKISEGGTRQPGSPDSINGKEGTLEVPQKEVPTEESHFAEVNPAGEGCLNNSENLDIKPKNCINDMKSSQLTEVVQEPKANTEKGLCDFDLNQEICSDDMDCSVNPVSTPVSFVSASRPAAALGWPIAPLQFEGTLGWKGSAATSAFRPASTRMTPDGDKTLSMGRTCNSAKQRRDCLDIDLNMAEDGDANLVSVKEIPVSSGLRSRESSVEVNTRRSGRPTLDLNLLSDDGDALLSDSKNDRGLFFHRNFPRSPSPALSSSSKQLSMRNFDLNDRPSFCNDTSDQGPYYHGKFFHNINAYGESKTDDPVISIMGTRVEVNKNDFIPGTLSLPNGNAPELAIDANVGRSGGVLGMVPSFSYTPVLGYNGLTTGPHVSFSSAIYGSGGAISYMVGSKGAPVVPQIMGSASGVPPYSQTPFIMSMTSMPPSLNGAGPSRPNFDLNSRFVIDGGNRDHGSLRQFFVPGPVRQMEDEHLRSNSQPSSSFVVGGKRKEPESGWDTNLCNYKLQQPPWK